MTNCRHCRHWRRPERWEEWEVDWAKESCPCDALLKSDQVSLSCEIHGDATSSHELETRGDFGCPVGDPAGVVVKAMEPHAALLAAHHELNDPPPDGSRSTLEAWWFPAGDKIRLVELTPWTVPASPDCPPWRIHAGPEVGPFDMEIVIGQPDQKGDDSVLPAGWKWADARKLVLPELPGVPRRGVSPGAFHDGDEPPTPEQIIQGEETP